MLTRTATSFLGAHDTLTMVVMMTVMMMMKMKTMMMIKMVMMIMMTMVVMMMVMMERQNLQVEHAAAWREHGESYSSSVLCTVGASKSVDCMGSWIVPLHGEWGHRFVPTST